MGPLFLTCFVGTLDLTGFVGPLILTCFKGPSILSRFVGPLIFNLLCGTHYSDLPRGTLGSYLLRGILGSDLFGGTLGFAKCPGCPRTWFPQGIKELREQSSNFLVSFCTKFKRHLGAVPCCRCDGTDLGVEYEGSISSKLLWYHFYSFETKKQ